jgi:hypothetical protein
MDVLRSISQSRYVIDRIPDAHVLWHRASAGHSVEIVSRSWW